MAETISFRYKNKPWVMLAAGMFFVVCAYFMFQKAGANTQGLIINKVFTFSVSEATGIYYVFFAFSALMALGGFIGFYLGLTREQHVEFTEHAIVVPKGALRSGVVTIPYADISSLGLLKVASQHFLRIDHKNGRIDLQRQMCRNKAEFEEIMAHLSARVDAISADRPF